VCSLNSKGKLGPKISALHNTAYILLLKLIWLDLNLCMPGIHQFKSVYAKAYTAYTATPPMSYGLEGREGGPSAKDHVVRCHSSCFGGITIIRIRRLRLLANRPTTGRRPSTTLKKKEFD